MSSRPNRPESRGPNQSRSRSEGSRPGIRGATRNSDAVPTRFILSAADNLAVNWRIGSKPNVSSPVRERGYMRPITRSLGFLIVSVSVLFLDGTTPRGTAHLQTGDHGFAIDSGGTKLAKIARAMSAGPAHIAESARIVDTDAEGNAVVLREGSNGFTCMPGNPRAVGDPPMCADAAAMQWSSDFKARKPKPTNTVPGIIYMLAGATQRSDTDPDDTTSPPIPIGPHWMILWPFDPKATGLPATHKSTGAYIMWAGSPYAHLHVMGRP